MPENIDWPWQYNFPPFFTLQPNAETKARQIEAWRNLVLEYYRINKESILDVREAIRSPLFNNTAIDRKLDAEFILVIMKDLESSGNAAPTDKSRNRWEIYWHTLEEWADIVYGYAARNGLTNTVCTLYELTQGDDAAEEEFHGLNQDVLLKVLKLLESQRKCELIIMDEEQGVKFY